MQHPRTPAIPLRTAPIGKWLRPRIGEVAEVEAGSRQALTGGVGSPHVERVAVTAYLPDGGRYRVDVVAKRASTAELIVLREITTVPGTAATFPELIDAGTDAYGPWVVMPFYPGTSQSWNAEAPAPVFESLARLHWSYLGRSESLPAEIRRVDGAFCLEALSDFAPTGIRQARRIAPHPVHLRALELLSGWAHDERLQRGLLLLPATLLHGDVYGANILVGDDVHLPRLVDWGSARIGPAMLDIALSASEASRGLNAYLRTWEALAGTAYDAWLAAVGHAWATAFSAGMFVGAVAERWGPEHASELLDTGEAALDRLERLLQQRPGELAAE